MSVLLVAASDPASAPVTQWPLRILLVLAPPTVVK